LKFVTHAIDWAGASSLTVGGFAAVKLGASLTGFTVIVNVFVTDVSSPPFSVPPLSLDHDVKRRRPAGIQRGREGQRAIRRDGRLA
jgi:hypothetical protein